MLLLLFLAPLRRPSIQNRESRIENGKYEAGEEEEKVEAEDEVEEVEEEEEEEEEEEDDDEDGFVYNCKRF